MKYPEVNFLPFKTPDFDNKSEEDEIAAKTTSVPFVGKTRFSVYLFVLHHYGTFIIILKCFPDFLHIQHFKVPRQFCQLCLQTKQIYCCGKKIQYHIYGNCNHNGLGRDFKL